MRYAHRAGVRANHTTYAGDGVLNCGGLHHMAPCIASTPGLPHVILKGNIAAYKNLNLVTVTIKRYFSREHSKRM